MVCVCVYVGVCGCIVPFEMERIEENNVNSIKKINSFSGLNEEIFFNNDKK